MLKLLFCLPDWILIPLFEKLSIRMINKIYHKSLKIPAYQQILKENSVTLKYIRDKNSLKKIPSIDKKNYISKYDLGELLYQDWTKHYTVERSSGYTGSPYYWPRYKGQDDGVEKSLEFALNYLFDTEKKTTIIFNTFALGTWVAGVKISKLLLNIANGRKSKITVVNVGVNPKECLEMFTNLSKHYDQVLIMGYNPVVKEILEMAVNRNFPFFNTKVNLLIGGEGFSEDWREYVSQILCFDIDEYDQKIVSGYAAADTGVDMGFEYPLCTFLRRLICKHPELGEKIFGSKFEEIPLFFQYVPNRIHIEEENGELLFTSDNSIPLIRYNLHDRGGVIDYTKLCNILSKYPEYVEFKLYHKILPLPIVYLWGRSDGTVTLLGAKIYLENIKSAVFQKSLQLYLTGGVHAYSDYTSDMKQRFNLILEAKDTKIAEANIDKIRNRIIQSLQKSSSEYMNAYQGNTEVATPVIKFLEKDVFSKKYSNGIKIVYTENNE